MKILTPALRLVLSAAGVCLLAGAFTPALAQGPGSGGPTPTTPAAEVPIDGGASLLLAGGAAYGLKRLRDRKRTAAD
ncbi:PID-CTERM protein-sorting domain-containing protein [Hymenobacter armeniacus]|uniref:PID-CTERM protein-sorting domain-containing protein n=1 Tax=Hymenobacter armeniacus TaxID=2771358 RepID=UPI001CC236DD|nr:hypothetical protein [Hymenobacter armeniacus]